HIGNAFVLIAFTIVVLGGMGSVMGALLGGLFIGVVESLCGLYLGESLGQIRIFVMFILVLLFRPRGLFGERAWEGLRSCTLRSSPPRSRPCHLLLPPMSCSISSLSRWSSRW